MNLVTKVRHTMKSLINATKNLETNRSSDVFTETSFNYSLDSVTFGTMRQVGDFTIQYLVSPNPTSNNTAPSLTYDQIITAFDAAKGQAFIDNDLILISYIYDQSDIDVDSVSGSVSLSFSINIKVTEKIR